MTREYKYEIWQAEDQMWYFHLLAPNGRIMHPSEAYPTRAHAKRGVKAIQRAAATAKIVTF